MININYMTTDLIKSKIEELCFKFEDDTEALNLLNDYINENVTQYMNNYEKIKKEMSDYISNFLYEEGEKYYYIKENLLLYD